MLDIIIWTAIGAFVGWNVPQPEFTKRAQDAVVEWFDGLFD